MIQRELQPCEVLHVASTVDSVGQKRLAVRAHESAEIVIKPASQVENTGVPTYNGASRYLGLTKGPLSPPDIVQVNDTYYRVVNSLKAFHYYASELEETSERPIMPHTVTVIVYPAGAATVEGTGEYAYGDTVTLTVTPESGGVFGGWSDGDAHNPRTFTMGAEDVTLTANVNQMLCLNYTAPNGCYFGFSAAASGSAYKVLDANIPTKSLSYSFDMDTWHDTTERTIYLSDGIQCPAGEGTLYLKSSDQNPFKVEVQVGVYANSLTMRFSSTPFGGEEIDPYTQWIYKDSDIPFTITGDFMALMDWDDEHLPAGAFGGLFQNTYVTEINADGLFTANGAFMSRHTMFGECANLTSVTTTAPSELVIQDSAFQLMFYLCTSLVSFTATGATSISANNGSYAFQSMFVADTSLTTLNFFEGATFTATGASTFDNMFAQCVALTSVPSWTINVDSQYVCSYMFNYCPSITSAKNLIITGTIAGGACQQMFTSCSSLIEGADIRATSIVGSGTNTYGNMYNSCTSLERVLVSPQTCYFPADTAAIANYTCNGMFYGCTALKEIIPLPATSPASYAYNNMYRGCTQFSFSTEPSSEAIVFRIPTEGTLTTAPRLNGMFYGATGLEGGTPTAETTYYVTLLRNAQPLRSLPPLTNPEEER